MKTYEPSRLRQAVEAISPEIAERVRDGLQVHDERCLWWELSCCLLSSQVPFGVAVAAADLIDSKELLWSATGKVGSIDNEIELALRQPLEVNARSVRYRFPASRARQLARTHARVTSSYGSLNQLVSRFETAEDAREWLVGNAFGIGPKQASMFLRNIGYTYNLAIIDRHVLTYMTALGIETPGTNATGLPGYVRRETALRVHARDLGLMVGLLDWAIWIVMRVARTSTPEPIIS